MNTRQLQSQMNNFNAKCDAIRKQNDSDFQDVLLDALERIVLMTSERAMPPDESPLIEVFTRQIAKDWHLRDQVKIAIKLNNRGPM